MRVAPWSIRGIASSEITDDIRTNNGSQFKDQSNQYITKYKPVMPLAAVCKNCKCGRRHSGLEDALQANLPAPQRFSRYRQGCSLRRRHIHSRSFILRLPGIIGANPANSLRRVPSRRREAVWPAMKPTTGFLLPVSLIPMSSFGFHTGSSTFANHNSTAPVWSSFINDPLTVFAVAVTLQWSPPIPAMYRTDSRPAHWSAASWQGCLDLDAMPILPGLKAKPGIIIHFTLTGSSQRPGKLGPTQPGFRCPKGVCYFTISRAGKRLPVRTPPICDTCFGRFRTIASAANAGGCKMILTLALVAFTQSCHRILKTRSVRMR